MSAYDQLPDRSMSCSESFASNDARDSEPVQSKAGVHGPFQADTDDDDDDQSFDEYEGEGEDEGGGEDEHDADPQSDLASSGSDEHDSDPEDDTDPQTQSDVTSSGSDEDFSLEPPMPSHVRIQGRPTFAELEAMHRLKTSLRERQGRWETQQAKENKDQKVCLNEALRQEEERVWETQPAKEIKEQALGRGREEELVWQTKRAQEIKEQNDRDNEARRQEEELVASAFGGIFGGARPNNVNPFKQNAHQGIEDGFPKPRVLANFFGEALGEVEEDYKLPFRDRVRAWLGGITPGEEGPGPEYDQGLSTDEKPEHVASKQVTHANASVVGNTLAKEHAEHKQAREAVDSYQDDSDQDLKSLVEDDLIEDDQPEQNIHDHGSGEQNNIEESEEGIFVDDFSGSGHHEADDQSDSGSSLFFRKDEPDNDALEPADNPKSSPQSSQPSDDDGSGIFVPRDEHATEPSDLEEHNDLLMDDLQVQIPDPKPDFVQTEKQKRARSQIPQTSPGPFDDGDFNVDDLFEDNGPDEFLQAPPEPTLLHSILSIAPGDFKRLTRATLREHITTLIDFETHELGNINPRRQGQLWRKLKKQKERFRDELNTRERNIARGAKQIFVDARAEGLKVGKEPKERFGTVAGAKREAKMKKATTADEWKDEEDMEIDYPDEEMKDLEVEKKPLQGKQRVAAIRALPKGQKRARKAKLAGALWRGVKQERSNMANDLEGARKPGW